MKVWIRDNNKWKLEVAIVTELKDTLYITCPQNLILGLILYPYYFLKVIKFIWKPYTIWKEGFTAVNYNGEDFTWNGFIEYLKTRKKG